MSRRLAVLIAVVIAAAAIAGGCGGGGGSASTSAAKSGNTGSSSEAGGSGSSNSEAGGSEANGAESNGGEAAEGESGGSGSAAQGSSSDKAEFLKRADAACNRERKDLVEEITDYLKRHASDGIPEGEMIANMVREVVMPTVEAEIAAVQAVGAPAGEEQQVEALLAAQQATVDKVKQQKSFKTLEESEAYFKPVSAKMRAYGFTACTNSIQ